MRLGLVFGIVALFWSGRASADTYYIDASLSAASCTDYDASSRSCGGGTDTAWRDLDTYESNRSVIAAGDTIILRPGQYWQTPYGGLITEAGTDTNPVVYRTLPGEERLAEICTEAGKCRYNPEPECGGSGTGCPTGNRFYPAAAISISSGVEVHDLKTFGQVRIGGSGLVEGCDLGGGGPSCANDFPCGGGAANQGMVVYVTGGNPTIRNNRIHHSARGDGGGNGPCLMGYDFTATIENNEFSDCYDADIRLKDQSGHAGETTVIRNNVFLPNTLGVGGNGAFIGCVQDCQIGRHVVHNNLFIDKASAGSIDQGGTSPTLFHSNTLVSTTAIGATFYEIGYWRTVAFESFNNLHVTAVPRESLACDSPSSCVVTADYNCYWEVGSGAYAWDPAGTTYRSLSEWQTTGNGAHSVDGVDPDFVDASCLGAGGCVPEDLRRRSYGEDMTGSPYGTRCGAFQDGDEIIGVDWFLPPPMIGTDAGVDMDAGAMSAADGGVTDAASPLDGRTAGTDAGGGSDSGARPPPGDASGSCSCRTSAPRRPTGALVVAVGAIVLAIRQPARWRRRRAG